MVKTVSLQKGFTLLELMIAMAIFAVVSILAYSGLRNVQSTQEHISRSATQLTQLQTALTLMGRDIQQAVLRPIRDDYGDSQPALVGASAGVGNTLEFTRAGYTNPTGRPRSHLQRIAYGLKDDTLVRLSWPMLDRVQGTKPSEAVLLPAVKKFELRYMDFNRQWQKSWPPLQAGGSTVAVGLPRAIEATLDIEGWGTVVRLFRTAGEVAPQQPGQPQPNNGAGNLGDDAGLDR